MARQKTKYTAKELAQFEKLILEKRDNAQKELDFIKESLLRSNLSGTDSTQGVSSAASDVYKRQSLTSTFPIIFSSSVGSSIPSIALLISLIAS